MDFNETITFEGGINTDDTPQTMPKGDYRDFSYCRLGYNQGNAYAVVTSNGTLEIENLAIGVNDYILGAVAWQKRNAIIYFVYRADLYHQIWLYDIASKTHEVVLEGNELNFSPEFHIYHANIIDDILKWTDGRWDPQMYTANGTRIFNPPYQINLAKALDIPGTNGFYGYPLELQEIDAIKWPLDPPIVSYFTDPTRNDNKLRNKLFKFIIQPIYENGEVGVWSMYSDLDLPDQSELISGTNWVNLNTDNGIRIQFNTGPNVIRGFNLAVQQYDRESGGATPPFGVFLQLDKSQDGIANNIFHEVEFFGGVATGPAFDFLKNYDRLPIVSDCQEFLPTNQLAYVNFREGYDKPTQNPFKLNVQMDYEVNEVRFNPESLYQSFDVRRNNPFANFKIVYDGNPYADADATFLFEAGMVFQWVSWNSGATYGNEDTENKRVFYSITKNNIYTALQQPTTFLQNAYILKIIGDSFINDWAPNLFDPGTVVFDSPEGMIYEAQLSSPGIANLPSYGGILRVSVDRLTNPAPSLKVGATHEFGIVYGDRAYRDSTVYTADSMNVFVPWFYDIDKSSFSNFKNPFTVTPKITINHVPPVWATKYWIVAKPANEILSFGQYVTNANNGTSSWQSSVIFESSSNRYKIYLDNWYETTNKGAKIRHEIKVGDKLRFKRTNWYYLQWVPYIELDILEVGFDSAYNRTYVYTNVFQENIIEPAIADSGNMLFGQEIEIYTPRPAVDDTGNIFISTWKDITEAIEVSNPHTDDRAHGALVQYYLIYIPYTSPITPGYYINGDQSGLDGTTWNLTFYYNNGAKLVDTDTIQSANYDQYLNATRIEFQNNPSDPDVTLVTLNGQKQVVSNLNSTTPAVYSIDYGDVYLRPRNFRSGVNGDRALLFWGMEDPNYSDYWQSDIYNDGRTRIEDQNAKMTHRQATAIHSDSFIVGTQINGLSSFGLDNQNIQDMNPTFGPVVKALMSGREGKTLKCLQPKKENSLYIQYYPNEVGSDSTVRVSNTTFASWFDYKSLFGCTDPGATAVLPNGATMYFDNNSGVFIYSGANGQIQVSEIDPDTKSDYKFRTKTKQLAKSYNESSNPMVRTYVNESVGEVGFAFNFQKLDLIGYEINSDLIKWDDHSITSLYVNPSLEYKKGDKIIIEDIESGSVWYEGEVDLVAGNEIFVIPDPIGSTILPETAYIKRYRYVDYYDHVVFDYVNMRWRSTYDYNFRQYCNLGQTLVGWGVDNQLYLHNQQDEWNFHGDSFIQKVSFVSNEQPLMLKRYQDLVLVSDKKFTINAQSQPNKSYPFGMSTRMPKEIVNIYEGYGKVYYRKNLYDPRFFNGANVSTSDVSGWLFDGNHSNLVGQMVTIMQTNGEIFTGIVSSASYNPSTLKTTIVLTGLYANTLGVAGNWYYSDVAYLNGEDVRANALTHTLEYDPTIDDEGSVLFSVGIKGVLS